MYETEHAIGFIKLRHNTVTDLSIPFSPCNCFSIHFFSTEGIYVPVPKSWEDIDPNLHTVTVKTFGASVIERFGLRVWGVDDQGYLTLNAEKIKLHGWNHHTQFLGAVA